MAASTVKFESKGLDALIKRLAAINGTEVEVGFFEEDHYGPENNNLPVALVAYLNEYGHSLGPQGVPERPFMHDMFGSKMEQRNITWPLKQVVMSVFKDGRSTQRLLKELGEHVVERLRLSIEDYPGNNSPTTIARKGKDDPLRDTDKMYNSVKFKINK